MGRLRYVVVCTGLSLVVAAAAGCTKPAPSGSRRPARPSVAAPAPGTGQPTTVPAVPPPPGASAVRLTAVELQPEDPYPGGQLVVLVNDGDRMVDLACWTVRSESTGRTARILTQKPLAPGAHMRLIPESVVFDSVDTLSLLDPRGQLADRTPKLTDRARDDQLWFRHDSAWTFGKGFRLTGQVFDARLVVAAPDSC
jgi:hypothetical protein